MQGSDVATLEKFVNLPYPPRAVRWETSTRPGGNDWSLAALITMTPEQVSALLPAAPAGRAGGRVSTEHFQKWFPPSMQAGHSSDGGWVELGGVAAEAARFIAPQKSPLIHGDVLLFPADGLAYLTLYTM